MVVDKYGNYVRDVMCQLCGWDRVHISVTVHRRAILKSVKSICNGIKKSNARTYMKCHTNVNSTPLAHLPHECSYIVAIFIHNHHILKEDHNLQLINIKFLLLGLQIALKY
jgi:hypothetical protein